MEENRGTRAQPRRVQGETEKGRASKRNKAAAIFVRERLAHQDEEERGGEQGTEREREGERASEVVVLTRREGGNTLVADDDDNVSLTWFGLPVDIEPGNRDL